MAEEGMVQEAGVEGEAELEPRAKLAQHLARQPESRRTFDKFMKILEGAVLVLIAAHLALAIYGSIQWSEGERITAVWFALPVSVALLLVLVGVHGAGIRAFFPMVVPNSSFPLVFGSSAVAMGLGFVVLVLVVGGFWGAFAWGTWATDWSILNPLMAILGVALGAGILVAVLSDLYRRFLRSR